MNIQPVIQTSEGISELVHSTGEATLPTVNILCSPQNKGHKWRMFSGTLFCPSALSVKDDARMIRLHVVGRFIGKCTVIVRKMLLLLNLIHIILRELPNSLYINA